MSSAGNKVAREEFFIFGIGQGNSQLAVYEENKFAVLYDCGSSSQQMHPTWEKFSLDYFESIFSWKLSIDELKIEPRDDLYLSTSHNTSGVRNEVDFGKKHTKPKDANVYIKETLSNYAIDHLFIFFSHPDEDHINYICDDTIPYEVNEKELKVTAFLGGNWLGKNGRNTSDAVLTYLLNRPNTKVDLPYYFSYKPICQQLDNPDNYKRLLDKVKDSEWREKNKLFEKFSYHSPAFFQGSLRQLLLKTLEERSDEKYFKDHLPNTFLTNNALENINILSMNHKGTNTSEQSFVIAFTMPMIKTNIVCTGDANSNTLCRIRSSESQHLPIWRLLEDVEYLNVVLLPHHGSEENFVPEVFDLFKPSLLAFSAANGEQYGHPNKDVIDSYGKLMSCKYDHLIQKLQSRFEATQKMPKVLSFDGKSDKANIPNLENNKCFLNTNILQTIRFNVDGIQSRFCNTIEMQDGSKFRINTVNRVDEYKLKDLVVSDQEEFQGVLMNKEKTKIYVPINTDQETCLFYEGTLLPEILKS